MPSAPELNQLSFEGRVELVSIDFTPWGSTVFRAINSSPFNAASGLPEDATVTWLGNTWQCLPFQTGGFQAGGENQVRPQMQVADFTGVLYSTLRSLNFPTGAKVQHYVALAADVLSNNPFGIFQQQTYVINSIRRQDMALDLELATIFDWARSQVPGYMMTREDFPGLGSALLR